MLVKNTHNKNFEALKALGISDARKHFSEIINSSVNTNKVAVISHAKAARSKRAFVIGEGVLSDIFDFIRFKPMIETVESNVQISYEGFTFCGIGKTEAEAISDLLEDVKETVMEYFSDEEYEMNMQYRNTRKRQPYYLKLAYCETDKCLIEALGLPH